MYDADVVIVGAGIAGSALAITLARHGVSVLLLERTLQHIDRAQGEWLAPWGVEQAAKIDVLDDLIAAGGHYIRWSLGYSADVPLAEAEANARDLSSLFLGVQGALGVGHPQMCDRLNLTAEAAGAAIINGVAGVEVRPGTPPIITFNYEGRRYTLRPKLVVGADGRGSAVARQIGIAVNADRLHHIMSGLLVDDAFGWPDDRQCVGVEGDKTFFIFPQGNGRIRLYLCYARSRRGRFAGPKATSNFLRAFDLACLPNGCNLASARPAGPCIGYSNADTWRESPAVPGVVLIGDAAGYNDPTIGQGLSIAFNDVLMVKTALLGHSDWSSVAFGAYIDARRERTRRVRFLGRLVSAFLCDYSRAAATRRLEVRRRMLTEPTSEYEVLAQLKGPYETPNFAFSQKAWDQLIGSAPH
jgi:2-polyprenyl-6-methoxyphenol hydroxylase-like FAD-dependent oxidoreductase